MQYTMAQLVKQTDIPKSTILYYIKEGLLPQAQKIKPNVHKYNQEHINLLKYIKYMQNDLNCSISQIKEIMQNENHKLTNSKSMLIPLVDAYMGINEDNTTYSKEQILEMSSISESELDSLEKEGILVLIKDGVYTKKELSIINLVQEYKKLNVDCTILKEYASAAKEIIAIEKKLHNILCEKCENSNNKEIWHLIFETFFTSKQYILNQHSYQAFIEKFKEEL